MMNRLVVMPSGEISVQQITEGGRVYGLGPVPEFQHMQPGLYDEDMQLITHEDVPPELMKHTYDAFVEGEHPRGQPENKGQFTSKSGGHVAATAGRGKTSATAHMQPAHHDRTQWPTHIQKLRVPPAWQNVQYSHNAEAPLQVVGYDTKGRKQYIYHQNFATQQAQVKYARIRELEDKFDSILAQNRENQQSSDPRVREHADAAALIMAMGVRPGSEADTQAETKAYGATTLLGRHVVPLVKGTRLRFTGKKGVPLDLPVDDPEISKMLISRASKSGRTGQLFPSVSSHSMLDYIHSFDGGGFKSKDMRTHLAAKTAQSMMRDMTAPTSATQYKKSVREVAKAVSEKLGNTPAIALQSYIPPSTFAEWRSTSGV